MNEREEILIAAFILSLAFTIAFFPLNSSFPYYFTITFFIISPSFIFHELAHKYLAIYYGGKARFILNEKGLFLALLSSFFGFIIALPGAVYIFTKLRLREYGITALAGNLVNIFLSLLFLLLSSFFYISLGGENALLLASKMNAFLAMFNLIPFPPLDGQKVISWSFVVWAVFFFLSLFLYIFI